MIEAECYVEDIDTDTNIERYGTLYATFELLCLDYYKFQWDLYDMNQDDIIMNEINPADNFVGTYRGATTNTELILEAGGTGYFAARYLYNESGPITWYIEDQTLYVNIDSGFQYSTTFKADISGDSSTLNFRCGSNWFSHYTGIYHKVS